MCFAGYNNQSETELWHTFIQSVNKNPHTEKHTFFLNLNTILDSSPTLIRFPKQIIKLHLQLQRGLDTYLIKHSVQLISSLNNTISIITINNKDKALCVLEVVSPQGSDLIHENIQKIISNYKEPFFQREGKESSLNYTRIQNTR